MPNSAPAPASPAAAQLPSDRPIGRIEPVFEFHDAMPTGVTVAADGRIFINFPRWGDEVPFTVGEIRNGTVVAYPDVAINKFDPAHPGETLDSVQSVVVDPANRLWILDTAAPSLSTPVPGGAKLVAVDLATDKVETIAHDPRILWPDTLSVATSGYLYFTANQLHRQAQFHEGKDLRKKPYTLFRVKIDAGPVLLK